MPDEKQVPRQEKTLEEELRELSQIYGISENEIKGFYEDAFRVALNVVRRALFGVERFAQYRINQLIEAGLKTEIRTSLQSTNEGAKLIIEFIPWKGDILEIVKNRAFKKMIRYYDKEQRKEEKVEREVERKVGARYA